MLKHNFNSTFNIITKNTLRQHRHSEQIYLKQSMLDLNKNIV